MAAASSGSAPPPTLALDRGILDELVEILSEAGNADSAVQRRIAEAVRKFNSLVHQAPFYSCAVFAEMTHLPLEQRLQAGLLLKNNAIEFLKSTSLEERATVYPWHQLKLTVLNLMVAAEPEIRRIAGVVLAAVMRRERAADFPELIPALTEMLTSSKPGIADAAFLALHHVIEDEMELLLLDEQTAGGECRQLQDFYATKLVPRLLEFCSPANGHRRRALEILYLFQVNGAFQTFLQPLAEAYWTVNAGLAECEDVRHLVLRAINSMTVTVPAAVQAAGPQLLELVLKTLPPQTENYDTRQEACNLLASLRRTLDAELLKSYVPRLTPLLVQNCRFSSKDYEYMSQGLLVDDDALVPDLDQDIAPVANGSNHHSNQELSEEDDSGWTEVGPKEPILPEESQRSSWGDLHTVRKGAAGLLDHLSVSFPAEVAAAALPLIEQMLESPSWEVRESAVLILGAVAVGCGPQLTPYLERVLGLMLGLCEDRRPPLRSISLWALCRYAPFIAERHEVLAAIVGTLVAHMQDRNKACQQAAATALSIAFEDVSSDKLLFAVDSIVDAMGACLGNYQARSLGILFNVINSFCARMPAAVIAQENFQLKVLHPLLARWPQLPLTDAALALHIECVTSIVISLGTEAAEIAPRILKQAAVTCALGLQMPEASSDTVNWALELLAALEEACVAVTHMLGDEGGAELLALLRACAGSSRVGLEGRAALFSIVGGIAMKRPEMIAADAPFFLDSMLPCIYSTHVTVAHNAIWASGQILLRCSAAQQQQQQQQRDLEALLPHVCVELHKVLTSSYVSREIASNAALSLGAIANVYPHEAATHLVKAVRRWCELMAFYVCDEDKLCAFTGLARVLLTQPQAFAPHLSHLLEATSSLTPWLARRDDEQQQLPQQQQPPPQPPHAHPMAQQLQKLASDIVKWLRDTFPAECAAVKLSPKTSEILRML